MQCVDYHFRTIFYHWSSSVTPKFHLILNAFPMILQTCSMSTTVRFLLTRKKQISLLIINWVSDQWAHTSHISVVNPCFDDFQTSQDSALIHVHTIHTNQPCGRESGRDVCPLLDTCLDAACIQVASLPVCCTESSRVAMSALATQWKQLSQADRKNNFRDVYSITSTCPISLVYIRSDAITGNTDHVGCHL